jgi:hypothetical protein
VQGLDGLPVLEACDVDLSTALDEGPIDVETYDMITASRGCAKVGTCDRALARIP